MYTQESVSTDRYTGDESGSGREEAQNTTTVSSDWSVRPSDDTMTDATQTNSLSRLNPAATPFSFTGGAGVNAVAAATAAGSPVSGDLLGSPVGGCGTGGLHHHHHPGMLPSSGLDSGMPPASLSTASRGLGAGGVNTSSNNSCSGMGLDVGSPNSFGMMQGMMSVPYGVASGGGSSGHRQSSLTGRPVSGMMEYGLMPGGGGSGGGGGANPGSSMGGGGRMSGVAAGMTIPNNFLPPPGEESDQQELLRLQQTNYRVKMLPPPLTYEVHRKIWSRNEYGDDNDDDMHGSVADQQEESLHSLLNEDPIDKEQRLEVYKQIMLRWYSHIHVLEGKSEVAKRLVRVRRACPSLEEVIASLSNQSQQVGAAANNTTKSEGGDDDLTQQQQQQQPPAAATAFTRRSPSGPLDTEEILSAWSAQCWDWWQETVKRKPRRPRKQGEMPLGAAPGLPTSASAPMVTAMGGGCAGLDDGQPPHMASNGSGSPYSHHSPYTNHPNGNGMEVAGNGAGLPMAPSYTSFTDLSEEGGVDTACRSLGQSPQQQQTRTSSHSSRQLPGQPPQPQQQPPPQRSMHPQMPQVPSHDAAPSTSTFTTNGIRATTTAAPPRTGNPDDFLENDHLTLAFTTELLKSLEE